MKYNNLILNYLIIYINNIIYFFLFFQIYLYFSKLYVINGDLYHGISSYLLILHSALAITSPLLYYILFTICIIEVAYKKLFIFNIDIIIKLIYYLFIFCICHILLFLFTGFIWSDYSWGFFISLEQRTIKLILLLIIYFTYLIVCIIDIKNIINLYGYFKYLIFFLFFFNYLFNYLFIDIFEIHQNEKSLNLFLISVSGYYIFSIIIFIIYIILLLINIVIGIIIIFKINYLKKYIFYYINII